MKDFTQFVDLASERLGGQVLAANDEFFAPKENLLKPEHPVFIEDKYTDRGKWMDGWETRRRRTPGHDWCILRLGAPGILRGVVVDTSHFKGNFPEQCSLEAGAFEGSPGLDELTAANARWAEVLPKSSLRGDTQNLFPICHPDHCTHVRFNIYPDGGVARLRVYGEVVPDWRPLLTEDGLIDLAAAKAGGHVLASSDEFFSAPLNLLMPGPARNMGDGWETRRRRGPGHDWVIVKLGIAGVIHRLEVDTAHFKGNFPESCSLEARAGEGESDELSAASLPWKEVLARTKLEAERGHTFEEQLRPVGPVTHVRFNIYPDGGVSRLRVFGAPRKWAEGLKHLNALPGDEARAALLGCCGAENWARQMAAERPLASVPQLFERARAVWEGLGRAEWLEAFRSHPRIGEDKAAGGQSAAAQSWSAQEQAGARDASAATRAALAEANLAYEARFGYIFIVCATGKSSGEMLDVARQRLKHGLEEELHIAAHEQLRITQLRLGKLLEQ